MYHPMKILSSSSKDSADTLTNPTCACVQKKIKKSTIAIDEKEQLMKAKHAMSAMKAIQSRILQGSTY